ncbi:antichymotrypsin-2-like isoform X3 [Culicoides brevitarsis]|uniref:antichymotrypsin-2-like isoform X3 n=1 Tax=Culicoides brevitarsis TaxID=469753 RepID=UPI00307C0C4B
MVFHLLHKKSNILSTIHLKVLLFVLLPYQVHLSNSISDINPENPTTMEQFAKNSYAFGADLYKELASDPSENVVFSPMSIQTCLSMVYMAAKGRTFEEIGNVLKYGASGNKQEVAKVFQDILEGTEKEKGLEIANRIYVMQNYKLKQAFNELTTKHFKSGVESLDFAQNTAAAKQINTWVEEKTHDKIKDLIKPDMLDGMTRAVLVNAIYFKGKWLYPFNKDLTYPMPFYVTPTETVNVDMMTIKKHFKYGALSKFDATALEMEYKDSNISMLFILPNQKDGLKALEEKIHEIDLKELDSQMFKQEVEVFLPKFEFEFTRELNDVLSKLGMATAFGDAADFSELLDSPEPLKISKVIHKAFIKVDEEGAEAAAATAAVMVMKCAFFSLEPTKEFRVDHPFYFVLKNKIDHVTLFSGRIQKI